jgi:hypothetical protein
MYHLLLISPHPLPLPAGLPARSRFGEGRGEGWVRGLCFHIFDISTDKIFGKSFRHPVSDVTLNL